MPYKNVSAGRVGTTQIIGQLYARYGLEFSRERLYEITKLVFGDLASVQKAPRQNRYYTPEQVEVIATAFMLRRFGHDDHAIQTLLLNPETQGQAHEIARKCMRELNGLTELAGAASA